MLLDALLELGFRAWKRGTPPHIPTDNGKGDEEDDGKYPKGCLRFHGAPGLRSDGDPDLFYLLHNGVECFGVVHRQVGEHLPVEIDTSFFQFAHQFGVRHIVKSCAGIDPGNP